MPLLFVMLYLGCMNRGKVIKLETFISVTDDMEQVIEILLSEVPIDNPKRQKIEQALKTLRQRINEVREQPYGFRSYQQFRTLAWRPKSSI
jgi:prefoldin subunit 5